MRVLIRADSSVDIGAGHVSRCSALAEELYTRGIRATLLTRDLPGSVARATPAMDVISLPADPGEDTLCDVRAAEIAHQWLERESQPSWLIVDHYGLDAAWENMARSAETRVFAIDDLADRAHACDLLLDQNLSGQDARRYLSRVPSNCRMLLGPQFALLRPAFAAAHASAHIRDNRVKRVLFFFGGGDVLDLTSVAIDAIAMLTQPQALFDVVVGAGNQRAEVIREAVARMPSVTFHYQTDQMAALMKAADLSVGAGGVSIWERCCVGLPALVVVTAENQQTAVANASANGACVNLGNASDITPATIASVLDGAFAGHLDIARMSAAGLRLVDGAGAGRVADVLLAA